MRDPKEEMLKLAGISPRLPSLQEARDARQYVMESGSPSLKSGNIVRVLKDGPIGKRGAKVFKGDELRVVGVDDDVVELIGYQWDSGVMMPLSWAGKNVEKIREKGSLKFQPLQKAEAVSEGSDSLKRGNIVRVLKDGPIGKRGAKVFKGDELRVVDVDADVVELIGYQWDTGVMMPSAWAAKNVEKVREKGSLKFQSLPK